MTCRTATRKADVRRIIAVRRTFAVCKTGTGIIKKTVFDHDVYRDAQGFSAAFHRVAHRTFAVCPFVGTLPTSVFAASFVQTHDAWGTPAQNACHPGGDACCPVQPRLPDTLSAGYETAKPPPATGVGPPCSGRHPMPHAGCFSKRIFLCAATKAGTGPTPAHNAPDPRCTSVYAAPVSLPWESALFVRPSLPKCFAFFSSVAPFASPMIRKPFANAGWRSCRRQPCRRQLCPHPFYADSKPYPISPS